MVREAKIIYKSESDSEDIKFWNAKSFEEKLSTVQTLREQYITLFNKQDDYAQSRKRLRRVYRIIESK